MTKKPGTTHGKPTAKGMKVEKKPTAAKVSKYPAPREALGIMIPDYRNPKSKATKADLVDQVFDLLDTALEQMQQRQAARSAAPQNGQSGGSSMFGGRGPGMPRMGGAPDANMQAQMRARMRERFSQQFAGFIATLDEDQRKTWNAAMEAQLSAKRVTLYKLVDGKPQAVMARLGASDGSTTEVSGRNIAEGDQIISGERSAATESK